MIILILLGVIAFLAYQINEAQKTTAQLDQLIERLRQLEQKLRSINADLEEPVKSPWDQFFIFPPVESGKN